MRPARPAYAPRAYAQSAATLLATALLATGAVGCTDSAAPVAPATAGPRLATAASPFVSPTAATGAVGQRVLFSVRDASNGSAIYMASGYHWAVSDTAVAQVTAVSSYSVEVTLRGAGQATLTAKAATGTLSAALSVVSSSSALSGPTCGAARSVTITPATKLALRSLDSLQLVVAVKDAAGCVTTTRRATWTSMSKSIAWVGPSGMLVGVGGGSTTIRATVDGVSGFATVSVSPALALPVFSTSPSGVAFAYDDYARYASTADLQLQNGRGTPYALFDQPQLVALDQSVTYNGHPTMRYDQPSGTATSPRTSAHFHGRSLSNVWFRAKVRWMPGYTTKGTRTGASNAYKFLGWGWSGYEGRGTVEITNTNEYTIDWAVKNRSTGVWVGPFAGRSAGKVVGEWTDGQWYDYVVHIERTSSTTYRQRLWIARDGQAPVLRGTVYGKMTTGTAPLVSAFTMGLNFNQTRTQRQSLWYGQWEVVDGSRFSNPFKLATP